MCFKLHNLWLKKAILVETLIKCGRLRLVDDRTSKYVKKEVKYDYHANSTTPAGKTTVNGLLSVDNSISRAIHDN